MTNHFRNGFYLLVCPLLLVACASSTKPKNPDNICHVFKQNPDWLKHAEQTEKRWGLPVSVQMAIMYHESAFDSHARPTRSWLLGIIPWKHASTALGYSQALDGTWEEYQANTKRHRASRTRFSDASDFMGWYASVAKQRLGITPDNARHLYLAYHEGLGGYSRGTHWNKNWLLNVANRVEARAKNYESQLVMCEVKPRPHKKPPRWRFW